MNLKKGDRVVSEFYGEGTIEIDDYDKKSSKYKYIVCFDRGSRVTYTVDGIYLYDKESPRNIKPLKNEFDDLITAVL